MVNCHAAAHRVRQSCMSRFESYPPVLILPETPCVVAGATRACVLTVHGEVLHLPTAEAGAMIRSQGSALMVHAPLTRQRLGVPVLAAFDLLELFAFARPAIPAVPTPRGLAVALALDAPDGLEGACLSLPAIMETLLAHLAEGRELPANRDAAGLAARMGQSGWLWARYVAAALGAPTAKPDPAALRVWRRLPEWEETAPPPLPSAHPVAPGEARVRLAALLGPGAEPRPGQSDYAAAAAAAFAPRTQPDSTQLVLAEAGTGTGKTLGYIAPASLWAERNAAPVWISTFTRHLQRQIDGELTRLFPQRAERRRRVVVRKGRENYLCLLNLEEASNSALGGASPGALVPLGLIARWAAATADGDLQGGDLPGWFADLFGSGVTATLADRRGECIHSACPHWRTCFVEHTIRRARSADIVVANHALVMAQAAQHWNWGEGIDGAAVPLRYVFDEGHHLFDAADGAFAAEFSGFEAAELRRWLLGAEGARSRARGLRRRVEDLVAERSELTTQLDAILSAARALPAPGWTVRLAEETVPELAGTEPGRPNPSEVFLRLLRQQVLARSAGETDAGFSLECDLHPLHPKLSDAADTLARALRRLAEPLETLIARLLARLEDEADDLEEPARLRIEAVSRSLRRRALDRVRAWLAMIGALAEPPREPGVRPDHVMFLRLARREGGAERGRDVDVGLHRHWLDPTLPFCATLARPAHGVLITSATLRDSGEVDAEAAWESAEARVGANHLALPAIRVSVGSPFDYATQTRAFVVTDVQPGDIGALAAAYRALFLAAGGGALGLFTAIRRLRAVAARIAPDLEVRGVPLLAQHVDAMDNATLVDVFRSEQESCLLGTDAMRDGVDVPGRALRLVVFERVPWPRPDILHRERRIHLSGGDPKGYDDREARFRLRQGFGRLIRAADDRGVFVLLDRQTPSRLLTALPAGVTPRRVGLAEAVAETRAFLALSD